MRRIPQQDWHTIVAIGVAAAALVLHLLHIIDEEVVLAIILLVLALLLFEGLEQGAWRERISNATRDLAGDVAYLREASRPPDALLVGPRNLRSASEAFAQNARGDMTWFNVCLLMFRTQPLFDTLLRPAIANPAVRSIAFVLDESERERWRTEVAPKVAACPGAEKVLEPHWCELDEAVSFILCESSRTGKVEAHLSFWGEPFMSRNSGRDVPRYVFHVQPDSELLPQLSDLERKYRLMG